MNQGNEPTVDAVASPLDKDQSPNENPAGAGDNSLGSTQSSQKLGTADLEAFGLEEFADVPYTLMNDGKILSLQPPEEFRHVFSLLYALNERDEMSSRALKLTARAIKLNESNPSAWMYRHRLVKALSTENASIWETELGFTATILQTSRKNYQVWQHRRYCLQQTGALKQETDFIDVMLDQDAKNYHAWSHRVWLVRNGIVEGELDSTAYYIQADVRNNSAWNHRWVVSGIVGRENEVQFACDMVSLAPRNESAWNYLCALTKAGLDTTQARKLAESTLKIDAGCIPARRFLVLTASNEQASEVATHCELLAGGIDSIRQKYWNMQKEQAQNVFNER